MPLGTELRQRWHSPLLTETRNVSPTGCPFSLPAHTSVGRKRLERRRPSLAFCVRSVASVVVGSMRSVVDFIAVDSSFGISRASLSGNALIDSCARRRREEVVSAANEPASLTVVNAFPIVTVCGWGVSTITIMLSGTLDSSPDSPHSRSGGHSHRTSAWLQPSLPLIRP